MPKQITIRERLTPFSHSIGTSALIPSSFYYIEVFPTQIILGDLLSDQKRKIAEINISLLGPLKQFTVQLDLEKNRVRIWGETSKGWLRVICYSQKENGVVFHFEKMPQDAAIQVNAECSYVLNDNLLLFPSLISFIDNPFQAKEKLSLGKNKQLNWDRVLERLNLSEILPSWFYLGQNLPSNLAEIDFLNELNNYKPEHIHEALANFFVTYFQGILVPQLQDALKQGIITKRLQLNTPLEILFFGAKWIRKLFIEQQANEIIVLPKLLPQFFCGRMTNIQCSEWGQMHIEWTKKRMRRLQFFAKKNDQILLRFPKSIKTFRIKLHLKDKGKTHHNGEPFFIESNQLYSLDRFEH